MPRNHNNRRHVDQRWIEENVGFGNVMLFALVALTLWFMKYFMYICFFCGGMYFAQENPSIPRVKFILLYMLKYCETNMSTIGSFLGGFTLLHKGKLEDMMKQKLSGDGPSDEFEEEKY